MFRIRLIFALLGGLACLLAALGLEAIFRRTHLAQNMDDRVSRVLILRSEISRRLEQAGGQGGDVQISLTWNNRNDLDLSCVDPNGEKIWYQHPHARSNGRLDVDNNSDRGALTNRPVENIRWPYGGAPTGNYRVYVTYFSHNDPVVETPFKVSILNKGRLHEANGVIGPGERDRQVYQFSTITSNDAVFGLLLAMVYAMLLTGAWTAALGAVFMLALIGGQTVFFQQFYHRPFLKRNKGLILLGWGTLFGFLAGSAGQLVFSLLTAYLTFVPMEIGRYIGWATMGGLFGWLIALKMPNLPSTSAFVGGIIGGVLGSIAFLASLSYGSGGAGRLEGAILLGLAVGFMVLLTLPYKEPEEEIPDLRMNISSLHLRPQRSRPSGTLRPH